MRNDQEKHNCFEFSAVIRQLDFEYFEVNLYEMGCFQDSWYCDSIEEARASWENWLFMEAGITNR